VGKSTLASELASQLDATVVPGDDFFIGGVIVRNEDPATLFDACIDWRGARGVLRDLIEFGKARYHAFDWERFNGAVRDEETILRATPLVIFEGVYSARFELRDLIDVSILVEASKSERLKRLREREGDISDWEAQWHRAEEWYFSMIMSLDYFDFVMDNERLIEVRKT
jgi:uridine kinase